MPVRYDIDDSSSNLDNTIRESLQRVSQFWSSLDDESDMSDTEDEEEEDEDDDEDEDEDGEEEEEDETEDMMATDDETVTEPRPRSQASSSDFYRLTTMNNTELLEDLAAIVRILRQINSLHRIFYNNITPDRTSQHFSLMDYRQEDEGVDEEASKLLEEGLADLQTVLTTEHRERRRQSTLALLALLTYQRNHCSDGFLQQYLDSNGDYNPTLAMFAAATYDEQDDMRQPKCCRDIINAAEELCGPAWLEEFHKGKESALKSMLDKLSFVAKIRLKVRDMNEKVMR